MKQLGKASYTVVALIAFWASTPRAQAPQPPATQAGSFGLDASSVFETLTGQASVGFIGRQESFEGTMKKSKLSRLDGGEVFGMMWSLWAGENQSGRVAAHASFPVPGG